MRLLIIALAAAVGALAGCGESRQPIASLESSPAAIELPYPSFADVDLVLVPGADRPLPDESLVLFVHLLDEPGSVVRTFDQPLPSGWAQQASFRLPIRLHQSALGEALPGGEYLLSVGIYSPATRQRYALTTTAEEVDRGEYAIARVRVPDGGGPLPRFEFSDSFLPAEYGTDRQVMGTRWLVGKSGTLRAAAMGAGATLLMQVRIHGAGAEVRWDEEPGGAPGAVLRSDCAPEEIRVSGEGRHLLEWTVPTGRDGCEVSFAANYRIGTDRWRESRSLAFENLAWRSAGAARGEAP